MQGCGVLGLIQNAVRVFKADSLQVKVQLRRRQDRPGRRDNALVQVSAHAGVLTALPGV